MRVATILAGCAVAMAVALPASAEEATLARAEPAFLDWLDASGATGYVESGAVERYDGRDLDGWRSTTERRRQDLEALLESLDASTLTAPEAHALAAMRATLAATPAATLDASGDADDDAPTTPDCASARDREAGFTELRAALTSCFVEYGNRLRFAGGEIDRGTALALLHTLDDAAMRRALFEAFVPLWTALNGHGESDSPYRRLVALAAADARARGSEIDAAARAIGLDTDEVERWLLALLEAWREASPAEFVEPWDFRYVNGAAGRQLAARIPVDALQPVNERYFRDLGADPAALRVVFDLEPRPGKSPLAYTDFLARGRSTGAGWQRPQARVVGTYAEGGLFPLNELVHETGHAVHVSAIHARPAYMDWPDTLFTEAFADVPSWSVYEPAWQRRYLGVAADEAGSMRALYANVMLDVAWSLFELRLLRDPSADPNEVWTTITSRYLRIAPHPEWPWWAMRVQLVSDPGYMVNYGLGAVLTAALRERVAAASGPFDTGNAAWYPWVAERLLRYGSERDTASLLSEVLGGPIAPDALLRQLRRCRLTR